MLKLYYAPMTRGVRPRWMLEELEVPYELVRIDMMAGEHMGEPYLKIHPLGRVPALEDDGLVMFESAAICAYLADKYPEKGLAPAPGSRERAHYYQWLFFAMTEVEPHVVEIFEQTVLLEESERSPKLLEEARTGWAEVAAVLERELAKKEFICGERFTAADVVLGSLLGWGKALGILGEYPALQAYVKRVGSRPANRKSRAD